MKTKVIQFVPALLAVLAIGFGYFSQWCILASSSCYGTWVHRIYNYITSPFYFFFLYLLPIAIILIFVPRHIFISWLKLALWMIPVSFVLIASTPVNWTGISLDFFPFFRDDAARLAGQIFVVLSLILIVWKYIALRRRGKG